MLLTAFEPLCSRSIASRSNHCAMSHLASQTAIDYILATSFTSERAIDHSKMMNESVKKSLEKSQNVLEENRKNCPAKKLHKKDTDVYNNCYELRSRAIKKQGKGVNTECPACPEGTQKQRTDSDSD